jgi:hypothetical protein
MTEAAKTATAAPGQTEGQDVEAPSTDDMHDSPKDLEHWPLLRGQLLLCQETLAGIYAASDRAALRHQKTHLRLTLFAVLCGTIAVLVAIAELSELIHGKWLQYLEIGSLVIATIAVVLGVCASRLTSWLLERHKAERCRLAKFQYLLDPAFCCGNGEDTARRTASFQAEAAAIGSLTPHGMHHWLDEDGIPEAPVIPQGAALWEGMVRELADYYREKRWRVQTAFFERKATAHVRKDTLTRHLGPSLFFGSVLAALVHFLWEGLFGESTTGVLLTVIAAALPVLGAGVRTYRTANEFARNRVRYRAKFVTLRRMGERLQSETNAEAVLRDLWCCEQVLESEHREWLRLMVEAEWY